MTSRKFDPRTDLLLERTIEVAPELVWRAWTEPQLLMQWWTPRPWKTVACDIDLQPGGIFHTVMQSPEGEKYPYTGCYLEIAKHRRLVWTFLLGPGYRPAVWDHPVPVFSAVLDLAPDGDGTRYSAMAMHLDQKGRDTHAEMGFAEGWGTCADQMVALVKTL